MVSTIRLNNAAHIVGEHTHLGVRGHSLRRSELLRLLIPGLCRHLYLLQRCFLDIDCQTSTWPPKRYQISTSVFQLYQSDLHFTPGNLHPFDLAAVSKCGLDFANQVVDKDILLTLRLEYNALFIVIWEKANKCWLERAMAIFTHDTYILHDLEIHLHRTI